MEKEAISWGVMISIFGTLYLTGWHAPVMGKFQSWFLATHIFTPSIEQELKTPFNFDGVLITPEEKNRI